MRAAIFQTLGAALMLLLFLTSATLLGAGPQAENKRAYSGGITFVTDGGIPKGPCLRVAGRLTTPGFFDGLKRVDDSRGTQFRRGNLPVTHFPRQMLLQLTIQDMLCPPEFRSEGGPVYLTREDMSTMRLSFFWKRGLELRPAGGAEQNSAVELREPYAKDLADSLPKRFIWSYEFVVPSAGVPLTDHLVIVLRQADGHIVARVAARL